MFRIFKNKKNQIVGIVLSCLFLLLMTAMPLKPAYSQCADSIYTVEDIYEVELEYNPYYRICLPDNWDGNNLVVFAHGYISPTETLAIVDYEIPPQNIPVSEIITGLGYAFATTSYSYNGLVIPQAVEDIRQLVYQFPDLLEDQFPDLFDTRVAPTNIYLAGASEGGLVTALALEKDPELFNAGLAICGPVGNFRKQINYFGDFLVLFNYFFPQVWKNLEKGIPTPEYVPKDLVDNTLWCREEDKHCDEDGDGTKEVKNAIGNQYVTKQLLRVANVPIDPYDPLSENAILDLLWYGIFATNDANTKLGGSPYDNSRRWYSGSRNDWRLNWRIDRFHANPIALINIEDEDQTTGRLTSPLVTLHTTQDPIVPFWHETLYNLKTLFGGSLLYHLNIPVVRYGHCAFREEELLTAFAIMRFMSRGY